MALVFALFFLKESSPEILAKRAAKVKGESTSEPTADASKASEVTVETKEETPKEAKEETPKETPKELTKEEAKEKTMLTAEEFEKLASEAEKPERAQFERGVVYSKRWGMRGSDES